MYRIERVQSSIPWHPLPSPGVSFSFVFDYIERKAKLRRTEYRKRSITGGGRFFFVLLVSSSVLVRPSLVAVFEIFWSHVGGS